MIGQRSRKSLVNSAFGVLAFAGLMLVTAPAAKAQVVTYYWWDGTDSTVNADGGTGTWNTSTTNWDTAALSGANTAFTSANPIIAVFGGTASTSVALGAPITVGGLTFNTTGYGITADTTNTLSFSGSSTILFNNIAAAAITGTVAGSGNVILTAANPATTGTLTLNGTSTTGWSGTTTINAGMTLALAGSNRALTSTTGGITLNGGGLTLTNTTTVEGSLDRVNSSTITSNGGTVTYTNTSGNTLAYAETIGSVDLVRGQLVFAETNNMAGTTNTQTLTLSGLTRTGSTNTSAVSFGSASGLNITTNIIQVTGKSGSGASGSTASVPIIGPWAFYGTTPASPTDYAVYDASGRVLNASISSTAESSALWVSGNNVTLGAATTLTANRTINTLRYTGGAGSLDLGAANFSLQTYGVLNGGAGLTISTNGTGVTGTGGLTTPTGGGNLYLTAGAAAITVSAPINDNGGAVTVVKSGSNTLTLSSVTSNFSGGIVLNAGTLSIDGFDANLGASNGGITVNGTATLTFVQNNNTTLSGRAITVNDGAVFTIDGKTGAGNARTYQGPLTGNGAIIFPSSTGGTFTNSGSTFTGTITLPGAITTASLGDSSNSINLSGGAFTWTGGAKTFALRPFALSGTGSSTISNSGTGALVIQQPLAITGTAGARTLTLGGSFAGGANQFTGNITDGTNGGASVVSLTKGADASIWALSGTNTYTGATTLPVVTNTVAASGGFTFQGIQALSPNTSLNATSAASNGGKLPGTFKILDDSAGTISRSGVNVNWSGANGQDPLTFFVGNNNTANGGSNGSSSTTGSTIQLGNLNLTQTTGSSAGLAFAVTGANGYRLQIANVNITLLAATVANVNQMLNPTSAPLTVTGTVQQVAGAGAGATTTLQLDGTATGNLISGNILNSADGTPKALILTKQNTSNWTVSGTNSYTGGTNVTGGILSFTGNSTAANGAVAVSGGAIGGTGSLGGAVSLGASAGGIDLRNGAATDTFTLGSTLSIGGSAGANNLYFDLASAGSSVDKIAATGSVTMTTPGAGVVNVNQLGGTATRLSAGTYDIITTAGSMPAASNFKLATSKAFGQTFTLQLDGTSKKLQLVTTRVTSAVAATTLTGTDWTAGGSFSAGLPDYGTNVTINSAVGTTSLNASQDINSLTYTTLATTATTVQAGTAAGTVASNMLVIEAGSGTGITLNNTSGTHTISANIGLAASQTWTIATGGQLTVSGVISDFGLGNSLTKDGGGTLSLSGANTFTGGVILSAGTIQASNAAFNGNALTVNATSIFKADVDAVTISGISTVRLYVE